MLTKNTYYLLSAYLRRLTSGSYSTSGMIDANGNDIGAQVVGNSSKPMDMFGMMTVPRNNDMYGTQGGVWFGTGKTPARATDFEMESPITDGSSLTIVSHTADTTPVTCTVDETCMRITNTYELTNHTDADIVISEVGLFGRCTSTLILLLDRTVLDEPIAIPPGETVPISYEIKFPYGV